MNLSLLLVVSLPENALQCVLHLLLGDEVYYSWEKPLSAKVL